MEKAVYIAGAHSRARTLRAYLAYLCPEMEVEAYLVDLPYVGEKIYRLLLLKDNMHFKVYWDGACSEDKILQFAPKGVDGFVLGTTMLFGKGRPYGEIIKEIRRNSRNMESI